MLRRLRLVTLLAFATVAALSAVQNPAAPQRTPPPKPASGVPDIQGLWANGTAIYSLNIEPPSHLKKYGTTLAGGAFGANRTIVVDPPDGILPLLPWALERRNTVMAEYRTPSPALMDPQTRGWPDGVPRLHYYGNCIGSMGGPIHIMQPPGQVVFLYEVQHEFRIVPLDARPHPGKDIKLWMGDSRGRWEGNTLVIDVTNHNDATRFDVVGNFHSDEMRLTERWTLVDTDTLEYRATISDPKVYAAPWTVGVTHKRCPAGTEVMEYAGVEGDTAVVEASEIRQLKGLDK
ncbi:MAG: hypothetical protein Q7J25_10445 [Vicinamibacterales bacterium]|nr:hypothetical protein [Vicinamibacterales bacterium]